MNRSTILYPSAVAETAALSTLPSRPPYTDRMTRKKLLRSTGSFSVLEETIVAPTPRKFATNLNSPAPMPMRRDKRRVNKPEESLFGDACQEIQTILLFSTPTTPTQEQQIQQPLFDKQSIFQEEVISELAEYYSRPESPGLNAPLRSSNPVPLNSPFQGSGVDSTKDAAVPAAISKRHPKSTRQVKKPMPAAKPFLNQPLQPKQPVSHHQNTPMREKATRKCEVPGRVRSKSWPSLPVGPVH